MRLKYEWRAIFEDDEILDEWDEENHRTRSLYNLWYKGTDEEVKQKKTPREKPLKFFQLIERETGQPKVSVVVRPGMKIIHRRRWTHHFVLREGPRAKKMGWKAGQQIRIPCWIVGWHENRKTPRDPRGINVQMIAFVFEDGRVELLDRWRDDNVLYHPVRLLPEEQL